MADQDPVFNIQRVYLKAASLEQPNAPAILLEQAQPALEINLGVNAEAVAEGIFEIAVTATVQSKIADKTVFLVEVGQAGIFRIMNVPEEQLEPLIAVACPNLRIPRLSPSASRNASPSTMPVSSTVW